MRGSVKRGLITQGCAVIVAQRVRCMLLLALLGMPASAMAAGPTGLRGIDLPTVLGISDQARAVPVQARAAEDDGSPRALKQLKLIVLDPGHGGENQGAIGVADIHEKFLTLELAYVLRDALQRRYPGTRVVLTRYWDMELGLSDRIAMANTMGADLFISLHYNAAEHERAIGVETYFLTTPEATPGESQVTGAPLARVQATTTGIAHEAGEDVQPEGTTADAMLNLQRDMERQRQHQRSGLLAETIQGQLVVQLPNTTNRGVKQANFGVLRGALMPAVVVEAGFVTHPREGKKVAHDPHRKKVVTALVNAVEAFDSKLDRAPR
jgi:N-acetylmuramoyl-L-alanine amidase